jgi:hypothetical protein
MAVGYSDCQAGPALDAGHGGDEGAFAGLHDCSAGGCGITGSPRLRPCIGGVGLHCGDCSRTRRPHVFDCFGAQSRTSAQVRPTTRPRPVRALGQMVSAGGTCLGAGCLGGLGGRPGMGMSRVTSDSTGRAGNMISLLAEPLGLPACLLPACCLPACCQRALGGSWWA